METRATESFYESLARIILPQGILDIFEITDIKTDETTIDKETGFKFCVIDIYLSELDLRNSALIAINCHTIEDQ